MVKPRPCPVYDDDEIFTFFILRFNVSEALRLLEAKPRPTFRVRVKAIQNQILGIKLDTEHAMTTDTNKLLILAYVHLPAEGRKLGYWEYMLIDGHHRLYKAVKQGLKWIDLHLLMPDESEQIRIS